MGKYFSRGFTLIELVIVIVIIGILSTISVPIYRNYVRRAMAAEGVTLVGSLVAAEKAFYAETRNYYSSAPNVGDDSVLGIDVRGNKYFTTYTVTAVAGPSFPATTSGIGDATGLTVTAANVTPITPPSIVTTGLEL